MNFLTKFIMFSTALITANVVNADEIQTNTAQMQALDKITGRVKLIEVPVNGNVSFGSLSIVVRDCKTRSPIETPDNFAFVDIVDRNADGTSENVFKGWMISSSQALNAMEHPVYDVWLLKCIDTQINPSSLLTARELEQRDAIPMKLIASTDAREPTNLLVNIMTEKVNYDDLIEDINITKEEIIVRGLEPTDDFDNPNVVFEDEVNDDVVVNHEIINQLKTPNVEEDNTEEDAPKSLLDLNKIEEEIEEIEELIAAKKEGVAEDIIYNGEDFQAVEAKPISEAEINSKPVYQNEEFIIYESED